LVGVDERRPQTTHEPPQPQQGQQRVPLSAGEIEDGNAQGADLLCQLVPRADVTDYMAEHLRGNVAQEQDQLPLRPPRFRDRPDSAGSLVRPCRPSALPAPPGESLLVPAGLSPWDQMFALHHPNKSGRNDSCSSDEDCCGTAKQMLKKISTIPIGTRSSTATVVAPPRAWCRQRGRARSRHRGYQPPERPRHRIRGTL